MRRIVDGNARENFIEDFALYRLGARLGFFDQARGTGTLGNEVIAVGRPHLRLAFRRRCDQSERSLDCTH